MTLRVAFAHNFHDRDWLGGKNYFASLFGAIEALQVPDIDWVFVTGHETQTSLPDEFPWLQQVRTSLMDRMAPAWLARQVTLRTRGTDPLFSRFLASHGIDLLSHAGPLGMNARIKSLPWLYDFQFMHLPEYWEVKHIRWAERRYRAACRYADAILVSSRDALNDLQRFAPWCALPKHVLPFVSNPVDFDRIPDREAILRKYDLPPAYFHLPNQFWSNKNHRLVADAVALLNQRAIHAVVACSGRPFDGRKPEYFGEFEAYCKDLGVDRQIRVLGVVDHADLQGLMAHSTAVINPSRFEGWSTTVEEAKTMHKTLLLSDLAVHREQSPVHGRFFGADSAPQLAELLAACLQDPVRPLNKASIQDDYSARLHAFGAAYLAIVRSVMAAGRH
jgi:glycosyltransferase involved in cell wall biosynthesis